MRSLLGRFHRPFARSAEEQLLLLNNLGDGSTLSLDFTTGILNPRLAFTRSTTGTFIGSNGLVQSAAINTPRFDHDPTAIGTPRGLLIEGSANNLLNWSETFDTTGGATNWNWSALNVTRGTVTTTNPTGASATVIKIEETTANGIHAPLIVPTVLASTTYTFSVWAKAVERTFVQLLENGGSGANSMVNLSTGAIVSESTAGITNVTAFGTTGWYRISMRLTTIAGQTNANCQLRLSTNGSTTSYGGTTGSGIYIWGAQLETGSGASSYIPTGASTGNRAADSAVMSDIGPLNYSNTNGTLYWSGIINKQPTSFITLIGFMAATDQPTFETFGNGLSYFAAARGASLSTGGSNEAIRTYTLGTLIKYAASVDTITNPIIAVNLNGSATSTNKVGTGDLYAATRFVLGRQPVTPSYGTNYPSVTIANIKYWPTTKTATELAALTA